METKFSDWKVSEAIRHLDIEEDKDQVKSLLAEYRKVKRDLDILQRLILALRVEDGLPY